MGLTYSPNPETVEKISAEVLCSRLTPRLRNKLLRDESFTISLSFIAGGLLSVLRKQSEHVEALAVLGIIAYIGLISAGGINISYMLVQQFWTHEYENNLRNKISEYASFLRKMAATKEEKAKVDAENGDVWKMSTKDLEKTCIKFGRKLCSYPHKYKFSPLLMETPHDSIPLLLEQDLGRFEVIHEIRQIVDKECFVGITGFQNAGKSTLIKSILGPERVDEMKPESNQKVRIRILQFPQQFRHLLT